MKKILVLVMFLVVAGCTNVKDAKFDGKNTDEILDKIKKSKDLSGEENSLLTLAISRYSLENISLVGKQVGELVTEQKKYAVEFTKYTDAVRNKMKDPESARFKNLRLNSNNVCGEVNGKNSSGGYVGYRRFFIENGGYAVLEGENFGGYVLERLECEVEILRERNALIRSGDKTRYSESDVKQMEIQRAFEKVYKKVCIDQTNLK